MTRFYDFSIEAQDGQSVSLDQYQGQVVLVVNTATGCGLTPQYEGLQKLYDTYKDQGFVVLDLPCNQFLGQAPGTAAEINTFCSLNYQTSFPRFTKVKVNGKDAIPLYQWLKEEAPGPLGKAIEWNFTKFLIDRQGQVQARYSSKTAPEQLTEAIENLL